MTTKNVFFDLDGVVIDSEDVIIESYRRAGIVTPTNILSLGTTKWLDELIGPQAALRVKLEKDIAYTHLMEVVPTLPGLATAQMLKTSGIKPMLLTGAPSIGFEALERRFTCLWPFAWGLGKLTPRDKRNILSLAGPSVYIDDQPFDAPHNVTFIRYEGQDEYQLLEEIIKCVFV